MRTRVLACTLAFVLVVGLAALLPPEANAASLAGVTLPDLVPAGERSLALNGLALRTRLGIKVYVAGLYLERPGSGAEAILAADAPRRMVMRFLRGVGRAKICEAWDEGLAANSAGQAAALAGRFAELCSLMPDAREGTEIVLTYLPGEGTAVEVDGAIRGRIAGKAFADALLACWIGPKPGPGEAFKQSLLGG